MSKKVEVNGGVGIIGLLGIMFVAFKLLGVIDWSWWWVTLPFWGGLAFFLSVFVAIFVISAIVVGVKHLFKGAK
jgi:hypothetical protein